MRSPIRHHLSSTARNFKAILQEGMSRRRFLSLLVAGGVSVPVSGCLSMLKKPSLTPPLPDDLVDQPLIKQAWLGIDPAQMWDVHAHLTGTGDSKAGPWLNPKATQWHYPRFYLATKAYMNAACADPGKVDQSYVTRLKQLANGLPGGAKVMLLSFDHAYDLEGRRLKAKSHFHIPNGYAAEVAKALPTRFEWIASIHPWRKDALEALEKAHEAGARAIKWLPPAQGIRPDHARCIPFYKTMARLNMPLLCHTGEEKAVISASPEHWGAPGRLVLAMQHGVQVIMAHCATTGMDENTGKPYFDQFMEMMKAPDYDGLLFGDISAVVLRNRKASELRTLLQHSEWHHRFLYGSDYPLPGILPLISLGRLQGDGFLDENHIPVLERLREHNPLLFAFVLTRGLRYQGQGFALETFQTRRHFAAAST